MVYRSPNAGDAVVFYAADITGNVLEKALDSEMCSEIPDMGRAIAEAGGLFLSEFVMALINQSVRPPFRSISKEG